MLQKRYHMTISITSREMQTKRAQIYERHQLATYMDSLSNQGKDIFGSYVSKVEHINFSCLSQKPLVLTREGKPIRNQEKT